MTKTEEKKTEDARPAAAEALEMEVIVGAAGAEIDLAAAASAINDAIDIVTSHEEAFGEASLEPRLLIGLEITKAKAVFSLTNAAAGQFGGRPSETVSRRDTVFAPAPYLLGLRAWLQAEAPRLKSGVAYKYATAFAALGLPAATATPAQIRERVKTLRHEAGKAKLPMPTIGALYRAGKPTGPLQISAPVERPGLRLEDAREHWFLWREAAEKAISNGILDDLDAAGLEEMKTFYLWLRDRINARLKTR